MQPLHHTTRKTASLDSSAANMEYFTEHSTDTPSGFSRMKRNLIFLFLIASCAFALYAYIIRPNEGPAVDAVLELQHISSMISQDDNWDLNRINLIFYHWGNLTKNQQQQIKQTKWFQQFAVTLSDHLKRNRYLDSLERTDDNNVYDLLNTLAVVIDAPNISYKYAKSEPITKVMRDKREKIQDQAGTEKKPATPTAVNKSTSNTVASSVQSNPTKTKSSASRAVEEKTTPQAKPESSILATAQASAQSTRAQLTAKPVTTSNTEATQVEATGSVSSARQTTADKPVIRQTPSSRQPKMLAKSNPMISAPPQLHLNKTRKITHPTPAELDYVINQYIDGYEKGNVGKILELLSLNAKTSAQSNAKEIGAYLKELFSTTKDRQLFIRNVKWEYEGNIAKGIGDIHTMILPGASAGDIISTKGKVQIIAKKVNNTVLITHLYSTQNPH